MSGVPILQTFSNQPPLLHPAKKVQAFRMTWNIHIIWYYRYACIKNDRYIYIYLVPTQNGSRFLHNFSQQKPRLKIRVLGFGGSSGSVGSLRGNLRNLVMQVGKVFVFFCVGLPRSKTNTWMGLLSWEQELDMGALNLGNYELCVFKMYTIYRIPLSVFNDWSLSSSWK